MAQTFSGALKLILDYLHSNGLDKLTVPAKLKETYQESLTNGTGANKAQIFWSDTRSLDAAANETLDLQALTGGHFGTAVFSEVKALIIKVNTLTTAYLLEVGAAAGNQWTGAAAMLKDTSDIIQINAGGMLVWTSPVDGGTVDGTHKDLKINNPSAGAVSFDIIIIGEGTES